MLQYRLLNNLHRQPNPLARSDKDRLRMDLKKEARRGVCIFQQRLKQVNIGEKFSVYRILLEVKNILTSEKSLECYWYYRLRSQAQKESSAFSKLKRKKPERTHRVNALTLLGILISNKFRKQKCRQLLSLSRPKNRL